MRGESAIDQSHPFQKSGLADDSHGFCRAAVLLWICVACSLAFIACGVQIPGTKAAPVARPEPATAPRSLESTLQFPVGIDEMPFYPEIARNARGDSVAVWEQFDGVQYSIWGNSRPAGQDWGRATVLELHQSGHAYGPKLALNAYGSAMAVWVQSDNAASTRTVWSNHLNVATGWGQAMPVDGSPGGLASSPQVAIDERGHVTAAWQQADGSQRVGRANGYRPGLGWGSAIQVEVAGLAPGNQSNQSGSDSN